jgi:hypothetical protein
MRLRTKAVLGLMTTAAILLAVATGSASATRLFVDDVDFRIAWGGLRFTTGGTTVACPVVLNGEFHSHTIFKRPGSLIGIISQAEVNGAQCANGIAEELPETLEWHVQYDSFTGRLPNITGIGVLIEGASFLMSFGVSVCLFFSEAEEPMKGHFVLNGGTVVSFIAEEEPAIGVFDFGASTACDVGGWATSLEGFATVEDRAANDLHFFLI